MRFQTYTQLILNFDQLDKNNQKYLKNLSLNLFKNQNFDFFTQLKLNFFTQFFHSQTTSVEFFSLNLRKTNFFNCIDIFFNSLFLNKKYIFTLQNIFLFLNDNYSRNLNFKFDSIFTTIKSNSNTIIKFQIGE